MTKIRAEISEIEIRKIIEKINEKASSLKCIKIDKSLVKLGKRGKDTTTHIRNQRVDIATDSKDIKRIIRIL